MWSSIAHSAGRAALQDLWAAIKLAAAYSAAEDTADCTVSNFINNNQVFKRKRAYHVPGFTVYFAKVSS